MSTKTHLVPTYTIGNSEYLKWGFSKKRSYIVETEVDDSVELRPGGVSDGAAGGTAKA